MAFDLEPPTVYATNDNVVAHVVAGSYPNEVTTMCGKRTPFIILYTDTHPLADVHRLCETCARTR